MLLGNPLFIIDDEADAASLNTKVNQGDVSSINKFLQEIIGTAQSSIYLQMTGTPQSLLLQSSTSGWHPLFVDYFEPGKSILVVISSFLKIQRLILYVLLIMIRRWKLLIR